MLSASAYFLFLRLPRLVALRAESPLPATPSATNIGKGKAQVGEPRVQIWGTGVR